MVIKKHSFYKKSLIKHPFIFKLIFITCFVGIIIGIVIGGRFNKINYDFVPTNIFNSNNCILISFGVL